MKALECDRCGTYYTKGGSKIKIDKRATQDLCPVCARDFTRWWTFGIPSTNDEPDYEEDRKLGKNLLINTEFKQEEEDD